MSIRLYQENGKNYPSVTSIIGFVFGAGEPLLKWSVKVAVEAILEAKDAVPDTELAQIGENARLTVLKNAGARGTSIHAAIDQRLDNREVAIDPEYEAYYRAFLRFLEYHQVAPILREKRVINDTYEYAGRLDCYAYVTCLPNCKEKGTPGHHGFDHTPVLLDFKTSKHLRPEYGLQLAAYRRCLEDLGYRVDSSCLLHLRESGRYTLKEVNEPFEMFANVLPVFNWKRSVERPIYTYATDEDALQIENAASPEGDTALVTDQLKQTHLSPIRTAPNTTELDVELTPDAIEAALAQTSPQSDGPEAPKKRGWPKGRPRKIREPEAPGLPGVRRPQFPLDVELDPEALDAIQTPLAA